jgi:hypothetical protein
VAPVYIPHLSCYLPSEYTCLIKPALLHSSCFPHRCVFSNWSLRTSSACFPLAHLGSRARKSSEPKRARSNPLFLPSRPYVTGIAADSLFCLATYMKIQVYIPPKHWFIYQLQGAIAQKIATFITTAARTSNPKQYDSNFLCLYRE